MSKSLRNRMTAILFMLMAGCGASPTSEHLFGENTTLTLPTDKYDAANRCYALQSGLTGKLVKANDALGYEATADEITASEAFFVKPAMLGQFMFHDSGARMLSASSAGVVANTAITDDAIWVVSRDQSTGDFSFSSITTGQSLVVDDSGRLTIGSATQGNDVFRFVLTGQACNPFPEMPTNVVGDSYKGQGVHKPVIGFADVHSHLNMAHIMSADDSGDAGAGGAFYGQPFHRLGVSHALHDCEELHGPNGVRDANNILTQNPTGTHDTQGWPTFIDWPGTHQLTHQAAYYRWLERAWFSGLRLLVNYGTGINGLCEMGRIYTGRPEVDCADHVQGLAQTEYAKEMQNYIDAQHGGPGKGWFRIVLSPSEARQVINEGKLAVVLGLEGSQMFNCGVTILPGGGEIPNCTPESFDSLLAEAWELGIRQVVPLHNIDNALAGGSLLGGTAAVMNMINFIDTQSFYKTVDCPGGGDDESYYYSGGGTPGLASLGDDPLSDLVVGALQGPLPVYPPGRQCNARALNEMGEYAFKRFAEMGMVVSLDHAPLLVKRTLLDYVKTLDPPFPIVSGHGYQGGVRKQDIIDIYMAGGYSYPYKGNGGHFADEVANQKVFHDTAMQNDSSRVLPFAMGYGMDVNGFGGHAGPRENPARLVDYPFRMFDGPGWGSQFAAAEIRPLIVHQLSIPDGRSWDVEQDGQVHYGMVPDFVEEVRLEGGENAITALYNSAEMYLQLWESIYNRRQ